VCTTAVHKTAQNSSDNSPDNHHSADDVFWTGAGFFHSKCLTFVLLSFFFLFFPRLISAAADWISAILLHMVCLSANLRCRSETCCTRLAESTGHKSRQKSPSGHHRTTLSGYIFATKAHIDNRKKNLLSSNMSSTCPHNMVNFGQLAAEIDPVVWGTTANFNGFRILAALLHVI